MRLCIVVGCIDIIEQKSWVYSNDVHEEPHEEPIPEVIDDEPNITLEYVREAKLKQMSTACKHTIENGFDLIIRGETHHFSLTTQDQLNLMNLSTHSKSQSSQTSSMIS